MRIHISEGTEIEHCLNVCLTAKGYEMNSFIMITTKADMRCQSPVGCLMFEETNVGAGKSNATQMDINGIK